MSARNLILWFEDEKEETTEYERALQDNFGLCSTDWSVGPSHTISAGVRYLLEAAFGNSDKYPLPDLILLDSKLSKDPDDDENRKEIDRLCKSNLVLKDDANSCLNEGTGGAVIHLLGKHLYPSFHSLIKVVYLSQYSLQQILEEHGGQISGSFPDLLWGYHFKEHGPDSLLPIMFDILDRPERGYSIAKIRSSLEPSDAEYLLGSESENFPWSDTYRHALTDLVQAGEDKAWRFEGDVRRSAPRPYVNSGDQGAFQLALQSHKQLPRALILAERGCGKEGFAKALHNMWYSNHTDAPFVSVNIGGVPPWSAGIALQLRLFGGQQNQNQPAEYGCVPQAWNGTLLLDELGDSQKDVQDSLLRLIQEGEYEPALWQRQVWAAHCCFIGATNRDLWKEGGFRTDLADRLSMYIIRIPSVLDVKSDIPWWMAKIARETAAKLQPFAGSTVPIEFELPSIAADLIQGHSWPGNLRELAHVIRRMQLRSLSRPQIPLNVVSKEIGRLRAATPLNGGPVDLPVNESQLEELLNGFANNMRTQGKTLSKTELYKYAKRRKVDFVSQYIFESHLKNRFGLDPDKLKLALSELAKRSGATAWGGSALKTS
jgi:transcriptional regulator with AAA-type ATPase domain